MDTKAYNQTNYVQAIYVQVPISTSNVQNATSLEFSSSACLPDRGGGACFCLEKQKQTLRILFQEVQAKDLLYVWFSHSIFLRPGLHCKLKRGIMPRGRYWTVNVRIAPTKYLQKIGLVILLRRRERICTFSSYNASGSNEQGKLEIDRKNSFF